MNLQSSHQNYHILRSLPLVRWLSPTSQLRDLKLPLSGELVFGLLPLFPIEVASPTDWLPKKV